MPGLKLYVDYFSQPCRAVLALCQLKKIPVETVELRVNKKQVNIDLIQALNGTLQKVNPLMMVPALEDTVNHINMGQSHTIMRYLSRRFEKQRPELYPVWDLRRATKIDEYLDYHHLGVRAKLFPYILNTVSATLRNQQNKGYDLKGAKIEVQSSLKKFNQVFLSEKFIVGDELSIADLSAYYELTFLSLVNYNFQKWNRINKWIQNMEQVSQVNNANAVFLKMCQSIKKKLDPKVAKSFEI